MNKDRIYWKKGLDITPEVLIDADTHYLHRLHTVSNLATRQIHGILDSKFQVKATIKGKYIHFDEICCLAITPAGYIIETDEKINFGKIPIQGLIAKEYYITLKTIPYLMEDISGKAPFSRPGYYLELSSKGQEINDGVVILKIESLPDRNDWNIASDYIPPLVSVCLHRSMLDKLAALKDKLKQVIGKLPDDNQNLLQLRLLILELNHLSDKAPAYEFVLLLKKICLILQVHLENSFEVSELIFLNRFINIQYDHNDVASILNLGLICLDEMDQKAVMKERLLLPPPPPPPVVELPPPPKVAPPPPPEILPKI